MGYKNGQTRTDRSELSEKNQDFPKNVFKKYFFLVLTDFSSNTGEYVEKYRKKMIFDESMRSFRLRMVKNDPEYSHHQSQQTIFFLEFPENNFKFVCLCFPFLTVSSSKIGLGGTRKNPKVNPIRSF